MDNERGTGRTTRQIMLMQQGDIFIVSNMAMRDYTLGLIEKHRPDLAIDRQTVMVMGDGVFVADKVRGSNRRMIVDHHTEGLLHRNALREIYQVNDRFNRAA